MKTLVFDIEGDYAHFKKIYATTSAITYPIPPKTTLYGLIWAIGCIAKSENKNLYLKYFSDKQCLLGINILRQIETQRININLRPKLGRLNENDNRKPTMIEYIYKPKYRIYFSHENHELYNSVKTNLEKKTTIYTPTLGLANLMAHINYIGEFEAEKKVSNNLITINSVCPKTKFKEFDLENLMDNEIIEQSMYSIEIDLDRNITERDDILMDRTAKPITAYFNEFYEIKNLCNAILF